MANVKWIKVTTDIFDDDKIRLLETMPNGSLYVLGWIKLLCLAGKQNTGGRFIMELKDYDMPLSANDIGRIIGISPAIMEDAIKQYEAFGMVEWVDGVLTISNWEKHQNVDAMDEIKQEQRRQKNRDRQNRYRENRKNVGCNADVTQDNVTCNAKETLRNAPVTQCNATDIDIDKDIDIDTENDDDDDDQTDGDIYRIRDDHDQIFALWKHCGFTLTDRVMDQLVELYGKHGIEKLTESIKKMADASPKGGVMQYLYKVLDNYGQPKQPKQREPAKVVIAQQFTQRDYVPDDDYLDRLLEG